MEVKLIVTKGGIMKTGLITVFLILMGWHSSWANTAPKAETCQVPICQVDQKFKDFKSWPQHQRLQYLKDLRAEYRTADKPEIFKNILDFANLVKPWIIAERFEDWVIREIDYLGNLARLGLIKYYPTHSTELNQWFDELSDISSKFEALNFWSARVNQERSYQRVLGLVSLGEHARRWAIEAKQEDYLVREGAQLISNASQHMSRLRPAHEGVYAIKMNCDPRPEDCRGEGLELTHLSVLDGLNFRGLVVSFSDIYTNRPSYLYTSAELTQNGTVVKSRSTEATPFTRVSEVFIEIDPATGLIKGWIDDVELKLRITFTGEPLRRLIQFYDDPYKSEWSTEILGRYQGLIGETAAELVVARYTTGEIVGVITTKHYRFAFRGGSYTVERGVLLLTSAGSGLDSGDRKVVLAQRPNAEGEMELTGFLFMNAPQSPSLKFKKIQ